VDPKAPSSPKQFTKHIYATTTATFSKSGNYVASGDISGQVKIWDSSVRVEGGSLDQPIIKGEYQVLSGAVKSIAWDGDNSRIIAVGQGKDKFGHCFTWDSGNSVGEIQGHSDQVNAVDIKPQRPYRAATAGADKAMIFYKGPPFKFDKSLRNIHTNTICDVKFSPDGKWLVSVGTDRTIAIYDGNTGEFGVKVDNAHQGGIFGIAWYNDSSKFVTCSGDNTIKEWAIGSSNECECVATYVVETPSSVENQQLGVVVTKDYIISVSYNGNLNYFQPGNSEPVEVISGHQKAITAVKLAGDVLYTGGSDGKVFQWTIENGEIAPIPQRLGTCKTSHTNLIVDIVAVDSKGSILTCGWDDKLKIWNQGEVISTVDLNGQPRQVIPNGDNGGFIVLFENKVEIYSQELAKIDEVKFDFSGTSVEVNGNGNTLWILNGTKNQVEEYTIGGNIEKTSLVYQPLRSQPTLVRQSPNGKYLAVSDTTGKYTLYNSEDATVVTTRWAFHTTRVGDSKWSPDGEFLASGGLDGAVFIYSVSRPSKVLKFPLAHQNGVSGIEWLTYDKTSTIITTGLDGIIKKWTVDLSQY
jgi:WD40 repeat protein